MKKKYLILILAILLVLSMNVASAADDTTKEVISLSEDNTLGDPASTEHLAIFKKISTVQLLGKLD